MFSNAPFVINSTGRGRLCWVLVMHLFLLCRRENKLWKGIEWNEDQMHSKGHRRYFWTKSYFLIKKKFLYHILSVFHKQMEQQFWEHLLFCYKYFLHVSHCLEIGSLRYDAASRRALDGVQLLCSLLVDSITSPYIDGSGEDDPLQIGSARLQTKRTTSFKPHLCRLQRPQCITPLRDVPLSVPCSRTPTGSDKGRARWPNGGPDPAGSTEFEAQPTASKWCFEWVQIHHSGERAGSWPRWKLSVMIDGWPGGPDRSVSALPPASTLQKDT